MQSIESLTNDLWALQLTDQARIAINNDLRERWAQEANERDRHQGHLPVDDPRRQNLNDIGVPMGNNIDLYNGQQTRGVTKNTRPGNSPRDPHGQPYHREFVTNFASPTPTMVTAAT